jgi:hypothetical protein
MTVIDEDFQAWEVYKDNPELRWLFNKMEVAIRQGLHAGPAATAPSRSGTYLYRPIYNLYGMGIGATKFEYNESMYSLMINNGVVPPGYFWCEWIEGEHLSIDYEKIDDEWHTRSVWVGGHGSKDNLTRFDSWQRLHEDYAPKAEELKLKPYFLGYKNINKFNIEMIDDYIIEIHLRWGNDPFDDLPVGTEIIPVWNDEEAPEGEWRGNLHADMEQYSANGNLSDVRRGYVIRRNND